MATKRRVLNRNRTLHLNWQVLILCWSLLVVAAVPVRADDNALPVLTNADQIRRLSFQQAQSNCPVKLRGVITFFDQRVPNNAYRFIQDDSAGIYFYTTWDVANQALKPGQLVEIDGQTAPGAYAPVLTANHYKILGEGKFPKAKPVTYEDLTSGREDSQYVELHGIVHSVEFDREILFYRIDVATGVGHVTAYISHITPAQSKNLVDSDVSVKGVCITRMNQQGQLFDIGLMVPKLKDITIELKASEDPFAQPTQPISNILRFKWGDGYGHRVKVFGVVTYCDADELYVEDETEGMCVQTKQAAEFKVGDRLEVVGFPAKGDYTPMLQNAICRKLPISVQLPVEKITADEALQGTHDCKLVSIEATLLNRDKQRNESSLILQAGKTLFHAYMRWPGQADDLKNLQNGSKVRVSGVCVINLGNNWFPGADWRAESFSILLRGPDDIQVLSRPPWWTLQKMLVAMGLLCASILMALGWVFSLRRRVHAQTKTIEERLEAEAAMKARYMELFENANDVVFTHDLQGRMTSINKAGTMLLQRSSADILSKNIIDLIVEDQRPAARQWLEQVVSGVELPATDWDFENAAGQRLKLEINSRTIEQAGEFIEVEGIARDATERKRLEREIIEAANQEQRRLGHDLHDGVCQQLAAIAYRAHILARKLSPQSEADSKEAQNISGLVNESLLQTRAVARGLFPARLESEGLISALEEFAGNTGSLYRIKCTFSHSDPIADLGNTMAMHVYYIIQEAVLNAIKHGKATQVEIALQQADGGVSLTIKDNGTGFRPAESKTTGLGIGIMRYRARAIGSTLELASEPGQGTKISCKIRPGGG